MAQRSARPANHPSVHSNQSERLLPFAVHVSRQKQLLEASEFPVSYERAVPFCIFLKSIRKFILDAQSTFSPNLIGVPFAQSKFSLMNTG